MSYEEEKNVTSTSIAGYRLYTLRLGGFNYSSVAVVKGWSASLPQIWKHKGNGKGNEVGRVRDIRNL